MWRESPEELTSKYRISQKKCLALKCTGEHLVPFSQGGPCTGTNIVAACEFCNRHRHRRPGEISWQDFKALVTKRVRQGKWHGIQLE
ncbi:HNH endonuclease [Haliea sp. E17]|uniref:HNH endonuclease n=1 Tax=Haliea sp. E17 TaxID=3401576 RepID=UPI003AAEC20C